MAKPKKPTLPTKEEVKGKGKVTKNAKPAVKTEKSAKPAPKSKKSEVAPKAVKAAKVVRPAAVKAKASAAPLAVVKAKGPASKDTAKAKAAPLAVGKKPVISKWSSKIPTPEEIKQSNKKLATAGRPVPIVQATNRVR
jgi:hypothetical protein